MPIILSTSNTCMENLFNLNEHYHWPVFYNSERTSGHKDALYIVHFINTVPQEGTLISCIVYIL